MPVKGSRGGRGAKSPNRVQKTASPARATRSRQRSRSNSPLVQQHLEEAAGAQQRRTKLPKGRATQFSGSSSRASSPPSTSRSSQEPDDDRKQTTTNSFKPVNAPAAPMADMADMVADAITVGANGNQDQNLGIPASSGDSNLPALRYHEPSRRVRRAPSTSSFSSELNDETHDSPASGQQGLTAEEMVRKTYGDRPRIESAQCIKLAQEPARREPIQRRPGQTLNLDRRSNVEALLCHVVGTPATQQCKNCRKGHGPWNSCVVHDGLMCSSCSNCWFNASGARCTFHVPDNTGSRQQGHGLPQAAPVPAPVPVQAQVQPHQVMPAPVAYVAHQQQPATFQQPANTREDARPLRPGDITQYRMPEAAQRAMSRGLNGAVVANQEQRLLARIESAAKELGMRIAEYDEHMRNVHRPTAPTGAPPSSVQNPQQQ
ncbi:hypothetical protein JDV02_007392 [Purpureocillium takamizusanense]|uniref:Uncharacterized protein n=1 Tax=Purpureocillium takamizusanense TaxID=2060973 RepID=A0A9Q8QKG2_9HYPO|nr:uncharacterized protein JDV02_007392 [Purpureocillium takamizusanense]UNI21398.1 hypothetical protein JDV02_007392 [Purpureocillium takamizusanense]